MARASKFMKRMRERLIDGVEVKISNLETGDHERRNILRFIVKYKGDTLINYPQKDASREDYFGHWYGATTKCAMLMIDGYFALKHEEAFGKTAMEIFMIAYEDKKKRHNPCYWLRESDNEYFLEKIADDLLIFLKICDRRTGKRSLRKLDIESMKPKYLPTNYSRQTEYGQ